MSTFSPVGWPSNGMRMSVCVCVCVWTEWTWSMHYVGISTYQFIPYYASAIRKHTHTPILKPSEDSKPTGLKVDIADFSSKPKEWQASNVLIKTTAKNNNNNNKICQWFTLIFECLCQQHAILWKLGNAGSGSVVHCEQDVSVIHYKTRNGKGITTSGSYVSAVHRHQKKKKGRYYSSGIVLRLHNFYLKKITTHHFQQKKVMGIQIFFFFFFLRKWPQWMSL